MKLCVRTGVLGEILKYEEFEDGYYGVFTLNGEQYDVCTKEDFSRLYKKVKREATNGSLDYDLFVLNPKNKDTTPEQYKDCLYDALIQIVELTKKS